jgi:hypothetical protein
MVPPYLNSTPPEEGNIPEEVNISGQNVDIKMIAQ